MLLHDLLDDLEIRDHVVEVRGATQIDVASVVHDSRDATAGALFCCIPGGRSDGHDHAADAVAAGAAALLVERFLTVDVPQVRVPSVRRVIGPLCSVFQGRPAEHMRVFGVTGTNGKTSTTYLLESIARANGERAGVIGTVEARIDGTGVPLRHTTPEATDLQALLARMRSCGVDTVAMEVSSHALHQHRVDGTRFAAVAFTNLTQDHLDYHGSLDAYFEAKALLFDPGFSALAAVNLDDPRGPELRDRAAARGMRVCTYAVEGEADVHARDVIARREETLFDLVDTRTGNHGVVRSALVGRFNVANSVAAAATALVAGVAFEAVLAGLAAPVRVPGRFERVGAKRDPTVLVDYAHTPDALASVLGAARSLLDAGGRLLVVFGCGGDRDRAKRPLMGEVATRLADVAILTSDNPRSEDPAAIARDVLAGVPAGDRPPAVELDRRAAIRAAVAAARPGDVVVVAGKGHETGQQFADRTVSFDDRIVVAEELDAKR